MDEEKILVGILSAEKALVGILSEETVLTGVLTPADTADFIADYATDEECVAVIDDIFKQLEKGA